MSHLVVLSLLFVSSGPVFAKAKPPIKLSEQLLSSNPKTRTQAIEAFNKLPAEAQYKLVPDFMVAMSDPDPEKRKIASRILKAMNVKIEEDLPDTQELLEGVQGAPKTPTPREALKDIRSEKQKAPTLEAPKSAGGEPSRRQVYRDIQSEKRNTFDDLRQELEAEKRVQVNLDPSEFKPGAEEGSAYSPVIETLKDPDPWVRAQAARRLSTVRPAPVQAIPTLIVMLNDKEAEVRRAAAAALGSMGPLARQAVPALNKVLADPDPVVRQIASDALQQVQQIR